MSDLKNYVLQLADNVMILGQRNAEWCGHGPVLEQDIAITNISLDLIGEARNYYQYVAEIDGGDAHEDDYPFKRDVREWRNALLVEQPNGHWGHTMMRQFLFDCFHYTYLEALLSSTDERLKEIAQKSIKEARYHMRFSSEWIVRLGDGTEESHNKMQEALDDRIMFFDELFTPSAVESKLSELGIAPDLPKIKATAKDTLEQICAKATLSLPEKVYPQLGGKTGMHSEYLGYILSDLQYMQKSYPNCEW